MRYQKYVLGNPKIGKICKIASKNEHYCQITSMAFSHAKTVIFSPAAS